MALLPRWQYMTPEAKAGFRKGALTVGLILLGWMLLRSLLPWIILGLLAWLLWSALNRSS